MGDSDHTPSGDPGRSTGVHRASAGAGGSPDAGGTAVRSRRVLSSRPHGEKIEVHFKLDSSTRWRIRWLAFEVRHPRTAMYRAAMQQRLRVMNTTRQALSAWSSALWY